jgi:hypothetical protein
MVPMSYLVFWAMTSSSKTVTQYLNTTILPTTTPTGTLVDATTTTVVTTKKKKKRKIVDRLEIIHEDDDTKLETKTDVADDDDDDDDEYYDDNEDDVDGLEEKASPRTIAWQVQAPMESLTATTALILQPSLSSDFTRPLSSGIGLLPPVSPMARPTSGGDRPLSSGGGPARPGSSGGGRPVTSTAVAREGQLHVLTVPPTSHGRPTSAANNARLVRATIDDHGDVFASLTLVLCSLMIRRK